MSRRRIVVAALSAALLGGLLGTGWVRAADAPAPPPAPGTGSKPPPESPEDRRTPDAGPRREGAGNRMDPSMLVDRIGQVIGELDLSAEQKTKVDESLKKAKDSLSSSASAGEGRERFQAFGKTMNELRESLAATLSSEQMSKLDEKLPMLSRMQGRPGDGPGGRPDGQRPNGYRPDGQRPDGQRPDGLRPDGARPGGMNRPGLGGQAGGEGRGAAVMQLVDAALDNVELTAAKRDEIKKAVMAEMEKMRDQGGAGGRPQGPGGRPGLQGRPDGGRPDGVGGDKPANAPSDKPSDKPAAK